MMRPRGDGSSSGGGVSSWPASPRSSSASSSVGPSPPPPATAPGYLPKTARRGRWPAFPSPSPTPPRARRRRSPPTRAPSPPGDPAAAGHAGADRGGATPDYAETMLAANSPGARRLAAGPIGVGVRRGVQTLYVAVPVGYRVESFQSGRARVLTWGFTLLGNAAAVEPAAYFGLTHTELVWMEGRWRIAETRGGFGRRRSWRRARDRSAVRRHGPGAGAGKL